MDKHLLMSYGIDYDKGLQNCMGNPTFYKRILAMFLQDTCFEEAKAAYAAGDQKTLFSRIHELKGTSGNAALTDLYRSVVPLLELLRNGDAAPERLDPLFLAAEKFYRRGCDGIRLLIAE